MRNTNDLDFNFSDNSIKYLNPKKISWRIQVIDTGLETQTAGRLKRVGHLIDSENFMLTYGDGLSNIDLHQCLGLKGLEKFSFHCKTSFKAWDVFLMTIAIQRTQIIVRIVRITGKILT